MWRLVPALVRQMGAAYPELVRAEALITETLKLEETHFKQTLERGLKLLDEEDAKLGKPGEAFPGEVAFKLYDTFGFPLDLTQDVLRTRERQVAVDGFDAAMERQRADARKSWVGSGEAATEQLWFELREKLGATEFLGYDTHVAEGQIVAHRGRRQGGRRRAMAGDEAAIIVNQTPFYGESGGQMGDTGAIFTAGGGEFAVRDTQKHAGDLFVHLGTVTQRRVQARRRRSSCGSMTSAARALRANHSVDASAASRRCAAGSASM